MLRVSKDRVLLWRIYVPTRNEVTGEWRKYIIMSLVICTAHQILIV